MIDRDRLASALLSTGVTALFGWALATGFGVDLTRAPERVLRVFDIVPPPPPERVVPPRTRSTEPEGRAAPPALRARPKEVMAPPPVIPPPTPPPMLAAPIADTGPAPSAGATDKPGPGTGAGGLGDGRGGGGAGDGTGGGRVARRFRHLSGALEEDDLPEWMVEAGMRGVVLFDFTVGVDGRVTACRVTGSSGHPPLDQLTCRLFRQRLRYRPSLDEAGRPVADMGTGEQGWGVEDR